MDVCSLDPVTESGYHHHDAWFYDWRTGVCLETKFEYVDEYRDEQNYFASEEQCNSKCRRKLVLNDPPCRFVIACGIFVNSPKYLSKNTQSWKSCSALNGDLQNVFRRVGESYSAPFIFPPFPL